MNSAFCNTCEKIVPASVTEREGKMYLVKDCPDCGQTETLISGDAERYLAKRQMDCGFEYRSCKLDCLNCKHSQHPTLIFVDITNRCNLNCPICINNTPSMGFLFEPPIEYFDKIFKHFSTFDPRPAIQLFGGEPTVRDDLLDIVKLAKSYGLAARVVTNGVKLADPEYCRPFVDLRATMLVSYDGKNPEIYEKMRGSAKLLDLKVKGIDNLDAMKGSKIVLMTLIARGFNDHELPDFFDFAHKRLHSIRAIYFMPLAHTWSPEDWDFEPERTTTEDVENMIDEAFPDDHVEFLPAGFLGQLQALLGALGVKPLPFVGAHPNCESMYLLFSNGEKYVPLSRFLKTPLADLTTALREANEKMVPHMPKSGKPTGLVRARAMAVLLGVLRRHIHLARLAKGKGIGKLYHVLATLLGFAVRRKSRIVLERHTNVQSVLQIILLPFEDKSNIETDRLERCPAGFGFVDTRDDQVKWVPVCAWGLHKTRAMREIADYYDKKSAAESTSAPAAES